MSFGIRYIILTGVNCLFISGYLLFMILMKWDLSKRLIDLDVANKQDAMMLFSLLGMLLIALIVNVLLISLPKNKSTLDEMQRLIRSLTK